MNLTLKLKQIATIVMGQAPDGASYNTTKIGLPFFQGKTEFGLIHPTPTKWCSAPEKIAEPGDILLSVRAPVGPTNLASELCCIGRGLAAIRPTSGIVDRDYLWLFLVFSEPKLVEKGQGSTFQAISGSDLAALDIWVPKIEEQRSIATHLKAQLAAIEKARQAATDQITELPNLAHAIIRETLNHPDTETHPLGDVLEEVKRGVGASWADYPVLGATRSGLAPAREPVGKNPERYKPVFTGTVFYNPMRILIGSIAMVDEHDAPGITSPDYVVLRGRAGRVDSRWFYYWLRSPEGERCIASLARGAVRERMLFNRLAEGEIDLPPYEVQLAASQALATIRPLKTQVEAQLRDIELLPSRLLAQVFDNQKDHQNDD